MAREELLARFEHIRPPPHHPLRPRQSLQNHDAVTLHNDAPIEQDDRAHVGRAADQATESLFQFERRVGHQIVREAIQAARRQPLEPGGGEGLARHLERQFGEDQDA